MKNKLLALLLPLLIVCGSFTQSGCSTTSPATATAVQVGLTTADAAIKAWFDYVVRERTRLDSIKVSQPAEYASGSATLDAKEVKATAAYSAYQKAIVSAASADPSDVSHAVAAATVPLLTLITQLIEK